MWLSSCSKDRAPITQNSFRKTSEIREYDAMRNMIGWRFKVYIRFGNFDQSINRYYHYLRDRSLTDTPPRYLDKSNAEPRCENNFSVLSIHVCHRGDLFYCSGTVLCVPKINNVHTP